MEYIEQGNTANGERNGYSRTRKRRRAKKAWYGYMEVARELLPLQSTYSLLVHT